MGHNRGEEIDAYTPVLAILRLSCEIIVEIFEGDFGYLNAIQSTTADGYLTSRMRWRQLAGDGGR